MKDTHFIYVFWFVVALTFVGIGFLVCLVWLPIPQANKQYADVILGFISGTLITSGISYLLGGNPMASNAKKANPAGQTTAEISATITSDPKTQAEPKTESEDGAV